MELLQTERQAFELIAGAKRINEEWDARTETLSTTDQLLAEAVETTQRLVEGFDRIQPVTDPGISVVHTTIRSAVNRLLFQTRRMLEGLRSPDAGEARMEALVNVLEIGETIEAEINRVAALLGYEEPPDRTTATTTTIRRLSTTTTRTTRPTTTTRRITTTTVRSGADRFGRLTFCDYYGDPCPASYIRIAREYCALIADHGQDVAFELLLAAAEVAYDADVWDAVAISAAAELANCQNLR